jgi:hypothetical protein
MARKKGRGVGRAARGARNGEDEAPADPKQGPPEDLAQQWKRTSPSYTRRETPEVPAPVYRRLRGFAFDPSLSLRLETAVVNEITYRVPWEPKANGDDGLSPGPVGEYLEVVDYDPASGCFYPPVDLNAPDTLATDGLPASEGDPRFHQQMVYAVAMTTIDNFEHALGRPALWAAREKEGAEAFVRRLRVYPHALREANAYYSPDKRALLFGYFPAPSDAPERYLPGGIVFTCLSHDIIAHETTHALLDGMHHRFIEANHADALAFHEAFADIVALFQHFSFADVLRHQIRRTRGDLRSENLLGELAQQFGEAIGNYGALRSALGSVDPKTGKWHPTVPDPQDYERETEPHARGAILVAAVFDAFLSIYQRRSEDLLRIASMGSGILREGALHPDLVNRLAMEASKSAQHVLTACVRALDYCPPIDITFGDYLRAIVTADCDLVPDDDLGYRVAFIEAFRRRGIYPRDIRTLSVEALRWELVEQKQGFFKPLADKLRGFAGNFAYLEDRRSIHQQAKDMGVKLHGWIAEESFHQKTQFGEVAGIRFDRGPSGLRLAADGSPAFQVHSVRPARRVGPDGDSLNQLIISLLQTREVPVDPAAGKASDTMKFRGGATLILDLDTMHLRYAVRKDVADEERLERYRQYRRALAMDGSPRATYFGKVKSGGEPFAMLHRGTDFGRP